MTCTLNLIVALFLLGISVSEAVIQKNGNAMQTKSRNPQPVAIGGRNSPTRGQSKNENVKGESPSEIYDDQQLSQIKIKAASVNPTNLISALMMEHEDKLFKAVPVFDKLNTIFGKFSLLGIFFDNLSILAGNSIPQMWESVIAEFPTFFEQLAKIGTDLSTVATTEEDKLSIYNGQVFEELTDPNFHAETANDFGIENEDILSDFTNETDFDEVEEPSVNSPAQHTLYDSVTGRPFKITMSRTGK